MKIEAKKSRAAVTMVLDEDEASWLAQLAARVHGDAPAAKFAQSFHVEMLRALAEVKVSVPASDKTFRTVKGKLYALPLPDAVPDEPVLGPGNKADPENPPEPVAGLTPKFT